MSRKPKNPITKIRTKNGDGGKTFFKGEMIWKNDPVIEFLGNLDEACSTLSSITFNENMHDDWRMLRKNNHSIDSETFLHKSKIILFIIGGLVYTDSATFKNNIHLLDNYVEEVTEYMALFLAKVPLQELKGFIVPSKINSEVMVSRSVLRRTERSAVTANCLWAVPALNTMSDFLFLISWYLGVGYQWTGFEKNAN